MADDNGKERTSILVRRLAAGESAALEEILKWHNEEMVHRATLHVRRLRMYGPLYEGQEAVDDAVVAMLKRTRRGELRDLEHSGAVLACDVGAVEARDPHSSRLLERKEDAATTRRRRGMKRTGAAVARGRGTAAG